MDQPHDCKEQHLRRHGAFNRDAGSVGDPLFVNSEFFDPRDLVLVKYEMLRRVRTEGMSVARAAERFGFSRSGFYKVLAAFEQRGLPGLIPERPGPRAAHKLTADVVEFVDRKLAECGPLPASELAALILAEYELRVHPRSIERALAQREKKGRRNR